MHWTEITVTKYIPINIKSILTALSVPPSLRMTHRWDSLCFQTLWWLTDMTQEDVWNQFWTSKAPANVNTTLTQTNTFFWELSSTKIFWTEKKGVKFDSNWTQLSGFLHYPLALMWQHHLCQSLKPAYRIQQCLVRRHKLPATMLSLPQWEWL